MKLTSADIEHVANLARLSLSEDEKTMYADQLSVVLDYIERLNEVETETVSETCQVTCLEDVVREDEARIIDDETRTKLIKAFPEEEAGLLKVKAVFAE